jgi:hypothetical protein
VALLRLHVDALLECITDDSRAKSTGEHSSGAGLLSSPKETAEENEIVSGLVMLR